MNHHLPIRGGMTLIEAMIASSIFLVVIAAVFEASIAAMNHAQMTNGQTEAMEEGDRTRGTVTSDMFNTAVMLRYDTSKKGTYKPPAGAFPNDQISPIVNVAERSLEFTRMRTSTVVANDPRQEQAAYSDLSKMSVFSFDKYDTAPGSPFFLVNEPPLPSGTGWCLAPVWESNRAGLTFAENADTAFLRIYRYVLVPDTTMAPPATIPLLTTYADTTFPAWDPGATLRVGRLLRQYRNPGGPWTTLGVPLATGIDIQTFKIETNRWQQITGVPLILADDEVRLHMVIHRPLQPKTTWPTLALRVEIIASMSKLDY